MVKLKEHCSFCLISVYMFRRGCRAKHWDLFQVYKAGKTLKMQSIILTDKEEKNHDHISWQRKTHLTKFNAQFSSESEKSH